MYKSFKRVTLSTQVLNGKKIDRYSRRMYQDPEALVQWLLRWGSALACMCVHNQ